MKTVYALIIVMIFSTCSRSPVSEQNADDTTSMFTDVDSITYVEQRMQLVDKLSQLIDSIDMVIANLRRDSSSIAELRYQNMMNKLHFTKDLVAQDLSEVNTTALNAWDGENIKRIELNTRNNRRELDNVLDQMKKEEEL